MPAWLIVTTAVLFLAGSVYTALPTAYEKRRKLLMQEAYRAGFRVERFRGVADDHRFTQSDDWYLYWRPWTADELRRRRERIQPRLVWPSPELESNAYPVVPSPFEAFYMDSRGAGLVWREKGAPEAVRTALQQFKSELQGWAM